MAITLRTNKGTALSYEEMDINLSSFFYSASLSTDLSQLSLYTTGSGVQAGTSLNIPLNPYTGSAPQVAGNVGEVQYKVSNTQFGGSNHVRIDSVNGGLAINTNALATGERLRVNQGAMVVNEAELRVASGPHSASLAYGGTTFDLTLRNNYVNPNADIIIQTGGSESFRIKGDGTFATRGADTSLGDAVISGSIVFGKTHEDTYRSKLFTWDSSDTRIENNIGNNLLKGNSRGIILEGPQSAHILMGIQSSTGNEGFTIVKATPTSSAEPTYDSVIAHFGADGNVGIGTTTTPTGYQLSVVGSISGSNGLNIGGNAVVTGSITTNATLNVSGSTTLSGSVTLNTVGNAANATNYNYLVRESNGNVTQQVNAAPIPQGGIIMWSGAVQSLPSGWALCNGQTQNGVATPDLRNRFVVASNNTTGTPTTTISGSAVSTGGNTNHDHFGSTQAHSLTTSQMPQHNHSYKDSYYIEYNNPGTGQNGAIGGVDNVGPTKYKGSGDSDTDNKYVYWRNGNTNQTGNSSGHDHDITTSYHVPTFYSLAFIMYTG